MSFANGILLFGALAFAIPVILHILNRSRFKTIEWGAMHLLDSVIKVNHKRFRLEQLILLLVRCAIPILLAFCLARPVLTGAQGLVGNAPVSMVILLDNSYSMDVESNGQSRFQEAVDAAREIVDSTSRGSEISVITTGGTPTPIFAEPVFDSAAVLRRLDRLNGSYGASDLETAIDQGLTTLAGMTNARRELIIMSDFQRADVASFLTGESAGLQARIEAMAIQPELTILPIGEDVPGNVYVDSMSFSRDVVGVGQQLMVRVGIKREGTTEANDARVAISIDGKEVETVSVPLPDGAATQTLFRIAFEEPGSHVVTASVDVDDALQTDNILDAAMTVWDELPVLLVDGAPSSAPLEGETDFVSIAMTPFTFGRSRLADLIRTRTVEVNKLNAQLLTEEPPRVLVLANVSKLKDDQLNAIEEFVRSGGALLVTAGNKVDLNWSREKMYADGAGLLPTPFGAMEGNVDDTKRSAHLVTQRFDHPALELFNDPANGNLSTADIRNWSKLETSNDPEARVLARLDNGDALLVEHDYGEGTVLQWATTIDNDWNDLPVRPVFVPLVQQFITTMATRLVPPQNILAGAPLLAMVDAKTEEELVFVSTPSEQRRSVGTMEKGNVKLARFDETGEPGVYSVSTAGGATSHYVATTPRTESDLKSLKTAEAERLQTIFSAEQYDSVTDYLKAVALKRHGREIWRAALIAVLALMFLELFLQQRFARVRV